MTYSLNSFGLQIRMSVSVIVNNVLGTVNSAGQHVCQPNGRDFCRQAEVSRPSTPW
jgi:hypothetical protein